MRKVTLAELRDLALAAKSDLWRQAQALGRDVKLYLHWTAGHYGQFFDSYHINIDADAGIYLSTNNLAALKSHTYRRNSGAIGIALACAYQATPVNLGPEPPTPAQIEAAAQVVAVLAGALDLTIDLQRVMTHAEAADNLDGINPGYEANGHPYGKHGPAHSCERWDLWFLPGMARGSGGEVLRGKANWYRQNS